MELKTGIEAQRKKDSNKRQDDNHDIACDKQPFLERSRSSGQPAGQVNKNSPEAANNQAIESINENRGTVVMDAACFPQDIACPTDLTLLSDTRQKAEALIDFLHDRDKHGQIKPRTYRKEYLHTVQKKNRSKSKKEIRKSVGKQLRYLRRDITIIHRLLDNCSGLPLKRREPKYFHVIQTLYAQQQEMLDRHKHTIERPIARDRTQAKVELGAKIHARRINRITFLDEISRDAFTEGSHLEDYLEQYRSCHKCYPKNAGRQNLLYPHQ